MATSKSSLTAGFSVIGTLASAVLAVELAGAIGGHTPNGFQYAAASGSFSRIYHTEVDSTNNDDLKAALKIIKKFVDSHGEGELQATLKIAQGGNQQLTLNYNPPNLSGLLESSELKIINEGKTIDWRFVQPTKGGIPPIKGWAAVQLFNDFYKEYRNKTIPNGMEEVDLENEVPGIDNSSTISATSLYEIKNAQDISLEQPTDQ